MVRSNSQTFFISTVTVNAWPNFNVPVLLHCFMAQYCKWNSSYTILPNESKQITVHFLICSSKICHVCIRSSLFFGTSVKTNIRGCLDVRKFRITINVVEYIYITIGIVNKHLENHLMFHFYRRFCKQNCVKDYIFIEFNQVNI